MEVILFPNSNVPLDALFTLARSLGLFVLAVSEKQDFQYAVVRGRGVQIDALAGTRNAKVMLNCIATLDSVKPPRPINKRNQYSASSTGTRTPPPTYV
jgi:hypothetical protein